MFLVEAAIIRVGQFPSDIFSDVTHVMDGNFFFSKEAIVGVIGESPGGFHMKWEGWVEDACVIFVGDWVDKGDDMSLIGCDQICWVFVVVGERRDGVVFVLHGIFGVFELICPVEFVHIGRDVVCATGIS